MCQELKTTLVIPTGVVMNTPSELSTFKGSEDARKFFYLDEIVVTKSFLTVREPKKLRPT